MRKPKFTPVPHEVIDTHLSSLSESEVKVLLVILRLTHGWNRESQSVSLSRMGKLSGLSKGSCSDAVKSLEVRELIRATRNSTEENGRVATTYEPFFEDDPPFAQPNGVGGISDTPPFAQPNGIRNIETVQIEKESITPPTPSSENNPSDQQVIEALGNLTSAQKKIVHHTDHSGMTLAEAVAHHRAAFGSAPRRQVARNDSRSIAGFSRGDSSPRGGFSRTVTPEVDWRSCEWLMAFREKYSAVNPSTLDADWRRAYTPAMELTDEERGKALAHVVTCEGAWVKSPYNYLADKEFNRPPRPEPAMARKGNVFDEIKRRGLLKK